MNQKIMDDKLHTLSYWHSCKTFGKAAVIDVLGQSVWSKKYPDIIQGLQSLEIPVKNRVVLPSDVVYEIARHPECLYDFFSSGDGESVYATHRGKPLVRPFDISKSKLIPRQEALMLFGSYALFRAVDVGEGLKGE